MNYVHGPGVDLIAHKATRQRITRVDVIVKVLVYDVVHRGHIAIERRRRVIERPRHAFEKRQHDATTSADHAGVVDEMESFHRRDFAAFDRRVAVALTQPFHNPTHGLHIGKQIDVLTHKETSLVVVENIHEIERILLKRYVGYVGKQNAIDVRIVEQIVIPRIESGVVRRSTGERRHAMKGDAIRRQLADECRVEIVVKDDGRQVGFVHRIVPVFHVLKTICLSSFRSLRIGVRREIRSEDDVAFFSWIDNRRRCRRQCSSLF